MLSWYFDGNRCVEFIYGGCVGNDNRFETKEQCEGRCGSKIKTGEESEASGK